MDYNKSSSLSIIYKNSKINNYDITSGTFQGKRSENNDLVKLDSINNNLIFLIADGHGGKYISKIVCNKILFNFYKGYKFSDKLKCNKLFRLIDKEIFKNYYLKNPKREGSTLSMLILYDKSILGINLGDSNYLIRTSDKNYSGNRHRPDDLEEIKRVIDNKLKVIKIGKHFRIDGKLEISRSFGDFSYKVISNKYDGIKSAVTCIPCHKKYQKNFNYIIIATDGFWDFVSKKIAIEIIDRLINIISLKKIIEKLVNLAIYNGSKDNITIIVIKKCG